MAEVTAKQKALDFHALHRSGKMLVLPNIWDPLGAALLEKLGYPAVATASASVAFTHGYDDGEKIPFMEAVKQLRSIAKSVNIPVTADIESGYAGTNNELEKTIRLILETGVVGINIEDTDKRTGKLFTPEQQCARIHLIKEISSQAGISLFVNARTDVYIRRNAFSDSEKLQETLNRGKAYIRAGADCIFPIALKQKEPIQKLIDELQHPVNILTIPGIPDLKTLNEMGVARVSLGPSFLKIVIKAMRDLALKLKNHEGCDAIAGNDITTDYLKELINKK